MLLNRSIRSKDLLPPWLSSTEGVNQEQHRGWHRVVTLYAAQPLNSLKGFAPPLVEQHRGCQSRTWLVCRLSIIRTTSLPRYKGVGAVACQMHVPTQRTPQLARLLLVHSGTCSAHRFLMTHMFLTATSFSLWRAMMASNGQDELLGDGVSL